MTKRIFTQKELSLMIKLFKEKEPYIKIAKKFETTSQVIKRELLKEGYSRSDKEVFEIIQKAKEKALMKKYGVINVSQINDPEMQERRIKGVKNRRKGSWSGKENPNYKNKIGNNFGFKAGKRKDLGDMFFRSSWEANYARYLNHNNIEWEFEPKHFELKNETTYTPDFYLKETNEYIEVKGYWMEDAKEKYEMFKEQYPEVKIVLIDEESYKKLIKENKSFIEFE